MAKSGSINGVNFGYQKKSVKPTIRVGKSETAGKLGTAIDTMGAGGLDITLDVIAQSITKRDSLIAAFMQEGRGKLKPGTPDNDWYFSGICGDYSTDFTLSQYNPTIAYPLSFLFETDIPYLISDKVKTIGKQISAKGLEWNSADAIAFNSVKNDGFESATVTTYTVFDYWTLTTTPNPPSVLNEVYKSTAKHKYGSSCLKLVNNNGLTKFGEQTQPQNFEAGIEYTIGFYGYIENPSGSEIVLELKSNSSVVRSVRCAATTDFTLTYMTYTFQETPTNATISIYGSGNASATANHYIDAVFCMKSSDYPDSLIGQFITTGELGGMVDSIPDIQIDSLNFSNPMYSKLDSTIYTKSQDPSLSTLSDTTIYSHEYPTPISEKDTGIYGRSSVPFVTVNTITIEAEAGVTHKITDVKFEGMSSIEGSTVAFNEYVPEVLPNNIGNHTSTHNYYTLFTDSGLNLESASNINVQFRGHTNTTSYSLYIKNCEVIYQKIYSDYTLLSTLTINAVADVEYTVSSISFKGYTSNSSNPADFKVTIQKGSETPIDLDTWQTASTSSNPDTRTISGIVFSADKNTAINIKFYGKLHNGLGGFVYIKDSAVQYGTMPYTLLNTITIDGDVSKPNTITEIGLSGNTSVTTNPSSFMVTLQHGTGTTNIIDTDWQINTTNPSYTSKILNNLSYTGQINVPTYIRFYGKLENCSSALLSLKNCYANYMLGTVLPTGTPQNVYIYNTADKFTKCNVCNTLLMGSSLRIKQDGTGHFSYFDNYLTNLYQNIVSSKTNVTWSTGRITIDSTSTQGEISYTFDVRYPIDNVPFLILNVISGNPQIKIAVNEAGTTGQLFSIDENTATVTAGSHLWNLYNLSNCNLSESTNITVQILAPTSQTCVIGSFFFWTATITVDAELPKIFKDKINTFRVDMTEDALCLISLGIHDYKWGI
jgi:hypothetical protein